MLGFVEEIWAYGHMMPKIVGVKRFDHFFVILQKLPPTMFLLNYNLVIIDIDYYDDAEDDAHF